MDALYNPEDALHKGSAKLVSVPTQDLFLRFRNEITQTTNAILNKVVVWIDADILEHLCVLLIELASISELGEKVVGHAQNGICDDFEEKIVLLFNWSSQFVEEEIEDVVTLLDVELIAVAEDVHHDAEKILPHLHLQNCLFCLKYLSNGRNASLCYALIIAIIFLTCTITIVFILFPIIASIHLGLLR